MKVVGRVVEAKTRMTKSGKVETRIKLIDETAGDVFLKTWSPLGEEPHVEFGDVLEAAIKFIAADVSGSRAFVSLIIEDFEIKEAFQPRAAAAVA